LSEVLGIITANQVKKEWLISVEKNILKYEVYNTAATTLCTDVTGTPVSWICLSVCDCPDTLTSCVVCLFVFDLDIDECASDICHNGNCVNSPGSFQCVCADGYQLSSTGDECQGNVT